MTPDTAPRAMAELVDASLVESVPDANKTSRVRMLETTRAYARDQSASGRRGGRLSSPARSILRAPGGTSVSARGPDAALTDADLANARAAMEWAEEREDATTGLRLAGMTRLWHVRGQIGEAVRWTERMLNLDSGVAARGGPAAPTALRVTRLYGLGRAAGDPGSWNAPRPGRTQPCAWLSPAMTRAVWRTPTAPSA